MFPDELYKEFEIVFGNIRAFVPPPEGFDAATLTCDTFAEDIEALRQASGLVRPIVVGHSIGGTIVLEYARRYPDSVLGVAAIGAFPVGTKKQMPRVWEFFDQDADAERRKAHERNLATRRVPAAITTGRDFADLYIAQGALYWYDPTFDASPLWDGVEPQAEIINHIYGTLFAEYDLQPLDVPVFVAPWPL